ncbi:MAG: c-type cytochrome [Candidatus Baltobacteraceae bacterium]
MRRLHFSLVFLACCALLPACSAAVQQHAGAPAPAGDSGNSLYDPKALPSGPAGEAIVLGHDIIESPQKFLPHNVVAKMSCAACHLGAGTVKRGGSFAGTYARFPQWNKRAKRTIALQDRLAECFIYSMNGTPPAYSSKEMIAMVAYIAYLSRDVPTGAPQARDDRFVVPLPSASPDVAHGGKLYAQTCEACHQANGAGVGYTFPPLWGSTSFNSGAGMAHIDRMAGFVRYNMPKNAPGSLSMQDSYDVATFVLSHGRPKFDKKHSIAFPPEPASDF